MSQNPEWKIALSDLVYGKEEEDAVLEVLRSRWLTMGPRTAEFERRVADMVGVEYAVCVSSCTAALYLMLAALDIGPGDEVIVPSMSFVATVNVVVNRGATPVFCDITSMREPLIDPDEIRRALSPSTRAVVTMDYAGYPCDYDAIFDVISDYESGSRRSGRQEGRIHLLEDAAHGIGGLRDEQRALGALGDAGAFSFFSNKNLAIGEGGMVVTNRADIAERVRLYRQHGLTHSTWDRHTAGPIGYNTVAPGWNFRPTELSSALGLAQLSKIEMIRSTRQQVVQHYNRRLAEIPEIVVPFMGLRVWTMPACHIFPILAPDRQSRYLIRDALTARGIQTSHHYPPIHLFDYYQRHVPTAHITLPNTEAFADREVTLPLHPLMTSQDVDTVVDALKEALTR